MVATPPSGISDDAVKVHRGDGADGEASGIAGEANAPVLLPGTPHTRTALRAQCKRTTGRCFDALRIGSRLR